MEKQIPPVLAFVVEVEQGGQRIGNLRCNPFRHDIGDWGSTTPGDGVLNINSKTLSFEARMTGCHFQAAAGQPVTVRASRYWHRRDWARCSTTDLIAKSPNRLFDP
jgi:hypothetical protein